MNPVSSSLDTAPLNVPPVTDMVISSAAEALFCGLHSYRALVPVSVPPEIVTEIFFPVLCCATATAAPVTVPPLPLAATLIVVAVEAISPPVMLRVPERISIPDM